MAAAALNLLGACGGGGATPVVMQGATLASFGDTTSQQTAALAAASLDSDARTTAGLTGTLNRAANTASIGSLSGTVNAARTEVALTAGGKVIFTPSGNQYAVRYVATPITGNRTQGILGAVTDATAMPSGTATMTGPATVTIQDGSTLYDLTGNASIVANFGTNRVTTTLLDLDGTSTNGITPAADVTNVATVTITDSTIATNTFSGGTIGVTSSTVSALGTSPTTSVSGAFFGPTGEEVGGVLALDDTATGNLRVFGDFIGK
jgi:hypothetical protein